MSLIQEKYSILFPLDNGHFITVVLSLVMGLIMAVTAIVVDHLPFNYGNVFSIWAMITLVILLVSIFIPYKDWSGKLTGMVCRDEGSILYKLIDNSYAFHAFQDTEFTLAKLGNDAGIYGCVRMLL